MAFWWQRDRMRNAEVLGSGITGEGGLLKDSMDFKLVWLGRQRIGWEEHRAVAFCVQMCLQQSKQKAYGPCCC